MKSPSTMVFNTGVMIGPQLDLLPDVFYFVDENISFDASLVLYIYIYICIYVYT